MVDQSCFSDSRQPQGPGHHRKPQSTDRTDAQSSGPALGPGPPAPLHSRSRVILCLDGQTDLSCEGAIEGVLGFTLLLCPYLQLPKSLYKCPSKLSSCNTGENTW